MKRLPTFLILAACAAIFLFSCGPRKTTVISAGDQRDTVYPLGFLTDTLQMVEGHVRNGEAFTTMMQSLGMSAKDAYLLSQLCDTVFDVRKIRAGNSVDAYYSGDSTSRDLEYVVYQHNRIASTVFKCKDSLALWRVEKQVDTLRRFSDVTISSNLWDDMKAAGASNLLIVSLSDLYAWTVDFFTLQPGDRFRAIYDELQVDGETIDIKEIEYAVYSRDTAAVRAIRFDQGDGGNKYWQPDGQSMRKAFLKAPLDFTRVSSHFSYHRRHPIYGTVRPHTGVDYAAPAGTPVRALGDGVVLSAGWGSGGAGNMIRIRHNSVYETGYLHLRGFAKGIKAGTRVSQGEVIGYVGATGAATGPHLDFRVWKNGTPIDPIHMDSPSADPIKAENLPALDSLSRKYSAEIDSLVRVSQVPD